MSPLRVSEYVSRVINHAPLKPIALFSLFTLNCLLMDELNEN